MLTAHSMAQVIQLAAAFLNDSRSVVVRVKDRFVANPTSSGWRDLMINFFFVDDPNRHVCEVQVVHSKMLVARQGLPGHAIYGRTRNALEVGRWGRDVVGARARARAWGGGKTSRLMACTPPPTIDYHPPTQPPTYPPTHLPSHLPSHPTTTDD